jgi:hypothetical protein
MTIKKYEELRVKICPYAKQRSIVNWTNLTKHKICSFDLYLLITIVCYTSIPSLQQAMAINKYVSFKHNY